VIAGSQAFSLGATFLRLAGEPAGATAPEEPLAASHATCFGIGLRSVIGQRGGSASRILATSRIVADKGAGIIRIQSIHVDAVVEGLTGIPPEGLEEIGRATEEGCTISSLLRASVPVSVAVRAA
jgi:osmotically inducible protein OsmC